MNDHRYRLLATAVACTLFLLPVAGDGAVAQSGPLGKQADEIETQLVSSVPGSDTQTGNGETRSGVVSGDGRFVVFMSTSTNLGFTDTNNAGLAGTDLFLRDLGTGDLTLVTHAAGQPGTTANGLFSFVYDMSSDGRYVVYNSQGTNLVDGQNDLNGPPDGLAAATDLFVFDRISGESALVSHAFGSPATTGDRSTNSGSLSGDGRFVAFESQATNLVDNFVEGNGESEPDVYVYEIATGEISLISHAAGDPVSGSDGAGRSPKMSDDGRFVVFESAATDLVTGFTDAAPGTIHVYVHDRMTDETHLVSHAVGSSTAGGDAHSSNAEISGNGEFVTFRSEATDLVPGYVASDAPQIFVYDRTSGDISLVSHVPGAPTTASNGFSGDARISSDGRWIVHSTGATDLVTGQVDTNDASDLFIYDRIERTTGLVSHAAGSESTTGDGFAAFADMSEDGRFVAHWGPATNLVDGQVDENGDAFLGIDTFLWDRLTGESILLSNEAGSPFTTDPTGDAYARSIAADGSVVLFSSTGTGYVAGQSDTNNEEDVFVSLIDTTPPPPPGCTLMVTNADGFGAGSLRQAIFEANNQPGEDTICFAIPGEGPHTIQPSFALPTITDPLTIDGSTQDGATCDTWPPQLMIEIDGSLAGWSDGLELTGESHGSTIRGLVINRFEITGIETFVDNTTIQCNFIGTDVTGTQSLPNENDGIRVRGGSDAVIGGLAPGDGNLISGNFDDGLDLLEGATGALVQGNIVGLDVTGSVALGNEDQGVRIESPDNTIGGSEPGARNVISANGTVGIELESPDATGNIIQGNYIGTDITGLTAIGNAVDGILIDRGPSNTIGGEEPGAGNVISGNGDDGVDIFGGQATFNRVLGNLIGVGADGATPLGNVEDGIDLNTAPAFTQIADNVLSSNGEWGVYINSGTSDTQLFRNFIGTNADGDELGNGFGGILAEDSGPQIIGGTYGDAGECCEGNTIAYNDGPGVGVAVTQSVSHEKGLRGNRIFANAGLGIDLGLDGVTANDDQDADGAGAPNALQNYPVLDVPEGGATELTGTLNSVPSSSFRVDVYRSGVCDPSGYGEGEVWLGTVDVETDASGNTPITFDLDAQTGPGEFYTATAVDVLANTSEFSACVEPEQPVNAPPSASEITAPADGATVVVGGTGVADAEDPAATISVSWTASVDPEGADVTHTWQLAATDSFAELLLEVDAGADTETSVTLAELAAVLDGEGVGLGTGVSGYHRVTSSDGALETVGPTAEVTLIRGTITSTDTAGETPATYALRAAYPNPFNPSTTIGYALPESGHVRLGVFDLLGREVHVLVDGVRPAGAHRVVFDADGLPSGIYLVRLEAGRNTFTRQVALMK